jgi:uncharacterized repeat protein (TIGR01451 family)
VTLVSVGTCTVQATQAGNATYAAAAPVNQSFQVTQVPPIVPILALTKTHAGNFIQGQTGATYTVTVSNQAGAAPTSGTVTVTETVPTGLTVVSMSGTGWSCSGNTCTRSDVLNQNSSYPAITVTVNVAAGASSQVTNQVTVSGGGSASASATDVTTIAAGWIDNFESYALGSFPSANWQASGSTNTSIVNSTYVSPVQSAQMHGDIGGCWAALIHRQIPVTPPYTIQFYARNGNESLSGCHPSRAALVLNTGPSWTTPNRQLVTFDANGAFDTGSPGPVYALLTWVKVRVTYETPDANTVRIGYWINDQFYQSVTSTPSSYEGQLTWLGLESGEGTAWFDDVSVSSGLPLVPSLSISKTHAGSFAPGQQGATYTVTVSNAAGTAATTGTVTVTDTMPTGLTLVSMSGTGWSCSGGTCTRSDVLSPGSSYPPVTVTVNVAATASSPQVNQVSVSGGGSLSASASDSTTITQSGHPAFFAGEDALGNGVYYLQLPGGNPFGYYTYLANGWIYQFDMGYESISPGVGQTVYLWDLSTGHWWYTSTSLFPYMYDFTLNTWIYYFPDPKNAGHYTTNPRYFDNLTTGQIFTM